MTDGRQAGEPDDPLLRAIAQHWDEILAAASEEQRDRLRALVAGTAEPDPAEARAALADELLDVLPPDHPVIQILRVGVMYSAGVEDPPVTELADWLLWLSELVLPAGESAWNQVRSTPGEPRAEQSEPPLADDFSRRVKARLLSLPSVATGDAGYFDSAASHLIRLARPDRSWQVPSFQFAEAGLPWPIVQEVNELLDAAADPWGVTCWWVDPHERLNAAPAELLGTGQDQLLRRAAMAVGEEY